MLRLELCQTVLKAAHSEMMCEVNLSHFCVTLQLNGVVPHDNLVLIKMRPDEHGRFGFNVKVRSYCSSQTSLSVFSLIFHTLSAC